MYLIKWYPLTVIDKSDDMYPAPDGCDWVSSIDFIKPKSKHWDFDKIDMNWVKQKIIEGDFLSIFKRHNEENWSNERYCCVSQEVKVLKNVEIWESMQ